MSKDADPLKLQSDNMRQRQQVLAKSRRRLRNPLKRWIFSYLVHKGQRGLAARENCKSDGVRMLVPIRRALLESGRRLAERGILHDPDDVFFLELTELTSVLAGRETPDLSTAIVERKAEYALNRSLTPPPVVVGRFNPQHCVPDPGVENGAVLRGLAVSPGVVTGRARVLLTVDVAEHVRPGEILVAPYSDPGWTPYFLPAAGVVMDLGGQLSHGSVLAREYGLPAVVNVRSATRIIRTGQLIQVDGHRGVVTITGDRDHST
jgi:pyruvate,water dikinase